jgi:caffeoyl-CoA O-methyltransferase
MLDERARAVLARLEREDEDERERGVPPLERSRAVAPTTGRFLFSLVAPLHEPAVLEIGGSRGYSSVWIGAAARLAGGRLVSLEHDPRKADAWRRNVADAGLADRAELVEGDARETLARLEETFDVVFLDAEKDDYERLFELARPRVRPGGVVIADNVLSHADTLAAYSGARQADPALSSVTLTFDRGLELSVVLPVSV